TSLRCARRRRHTAVGARESLRLGRTREMTEEKWCRYELGCLATGPSYKGKLTGPKPPLWPRHVWSIRPYPRLACCLEGRITLFANPKRPTKKPEPAGAHNRPEPQQRIRHDRLRERATGS